MEILKVTTRKVQYSAGKATSTEYRLQKSPFGLRIHTLTFDGECTTLVRTIDGDGRRSDLKTFASEQVPSERALDEVLCQAAEADAIQLR